MNLNSTALWKYFKPCRKEASDMSLPDPSRPLSKEFDSTIKAANDEATAAIESSSWQRSASLKLDDEQRTNIGKYVAKHESQSNPSFCKRF